MNARHTDDESEIVWRPPPELANASQMADFMAFTGRETGNTFADYDALWQWSIKERADFWAALWRYTDVIADTPWLRALDNADAMPGASWFPGARLNFAENLLRFRDDRCAIVFRGEDGNEQRLSYAELYRESAAMAASFCDLGVGPGDRIAAIVPNIPQAVIGMLATAWLGAVWSSCSPDFGAQGILDRFGQIEPKLLIAVDGYRFKGRVIDIRDKIRSVVNDLPSCEHHVLINWQDCGSLPETLDWVELSENEDWPPPFAQHAFDHPLYILFSSGTTGKPKCIVHGAGGTLLQHLKEHRLHCDLRRDDTMFYFTTCGWMMWNWLVSGLASGATIVLFDGSPFHPTPDVLWHMADDLEINLFGASAKYISAQEKAGVDIVDELPLLGLRSILSTGSPLVPESFDYLLQRIKPGVQICSISGGTDIVSCFALGNPLLPVKRGQLQCRGLGLAVAVYDAKGAAVVDQPGELVCTKPFPCMPVGFWNDPDGSHYHAAYFERFPGIWTHGDWCLLTEGGGLVIAGRSDAVLNPGGVRIGTAEIYRQVERLPQIRESVCVGQPWEDDVRVLLFVVLKDSVVLDDALKETIRKTLRDNASPRHVPAKILAVGDIPRTRSGKISEIAVRDTVVGKPLSNTEALSNPEVLQQYRNRPELQEI